MKKKFAIVLSGCGVFDGSEIHEAVAAILAVAKNEGECQVFAPNIKQLHVVNHLNGEVENAERNVLQESARIARGEILPLSDFNAEHFDYLLFPGGFGAMKNLCNFAIAGVDCEVNVDVENAIKSMAKANKAVGAMCIAPLLLTRVLGNITITLGNPDAETLAAAKHFGAKHVVKGASEVCVDVDNKIVTSPAYMLANNITDVFVGADNLVKEILNF